MQLLDASVNWMLKFGNNPTLELKIDAFPDKNNMRYKRNGNLYYAELDGYVSFYAVSERLPGQGFGGSVFTLTMEDGVIETLKGPWSSRAGAMNKYFAPCVDVHIGVAEDKYKILFAGAVTLAFAEHAATKAGCYLCRIPGEDELPNPTKDQLRGWNTYSLDIGPTWIPTIDPSGQTVQKPVA